MMSEELIVRNEILNDGGEMHLYYSKMYEEYVAYGYSAFVVILNCMTEGMSGEGGLSDEAIEGRLERATEGALRAMVMKESYSEEMQMPMVKVNQEQMALIKSKGLIVEDITEEGYLHIRSFIPFDERKYNEWAGHLRDLNH